MNIHLPKELILWIDLVRKEKSRQSFIIDILYKGKKSDTNKTEDTSKK